jgi:hypothetical protein
MAALSGEISPAPKGGLQAAGYGAASVKGMPITDIETLKILRLERLAQSTPYLYCQRAKPFLSERAPLLEQNISRKEDRVTLKLRAMPISSAGWNPAVSIGKNI